MNNKLLVAASIALLAMAGTAQAGGDANAGKQKAATCAGCHGADGKGVAPNPPLAGLKESYFVEQLKAYKSGARANPMMKQFASGLSDQDMADLAAYYASLK
ncbi:MAG: c-type cytochrome [Burkholderiales bacterium]|nr:c-type cytochrome [Burkholderiales bacterium]